MKISTHTRAIGLIGHPTAHSISPALHNYIYQKYGQNYVYLAFDVLPEHLKYAVQGLKTLSFIGFNVTIPYKEQIISFLDEISVEAEAIGAVNTVKCSNGRLIGYNTDGMGFVNSLKKMGICIYNKSAVVIGCGGASRAICVYLIKEGIKNIYIINRTKQNAYKMIDDIKKIYHYAFIEYVEYKQLNLIDNPDMLINTTPVGMWPDIYDSPLRGYVFKPNTIAIDIIYNPIKTEFLKNAEKAGCVVVNGLDMLIGQAVEAIKIWTDLEVSYNSFDGIDIITQLRG